MRQQRNISLLLAGCILLTAFTGCGKKQTESVQETVPAKEQSADEQSGGAQVAEESIPLQEETASTDEKIVISIDTVEISEEELKAQDYIVTLKVNLEKNAGITYSEWGLSYDERCDAIADTDGLSYNTFYAFSESDPFLWTAWSGGAQVATSESAILNFSMKLPEDAGVGDFTPSSTRVFQKQTSPTNGATANMIG